MADVEARCMKCGEKKIMVDPQKTKTKNNRTMIKGKCPDCGTTMCLCVSDKK